MYLLLRFLSPKLQEGVGLEDNNAFGMCCRLNELRYLPFALQRATSRRLLTASRGAPSKHITSGTSSESTSVSQMWTAVEVTFRLVSRLLEDSPIPTRTRHRPVRRHQQLPVGVQVRTEQR